MVHKIDIRKLKIKKVKGKVTGTVMYKVNGLFFTKRSDAIEHRDAVIRQIRTERKGFKR